MKQYILLRSMFLAGAIMTVPPLMAASNKAVTDFIAALPNQEKLSAIGMDQNLETVKRLTDLNPNRDNQIVPIVADYQKCAAPIAAEKVRRTLENVANRLSPKQLKKMTEFYRSGENDKISRFVIKRERGEQPSYDDYAIITELAVSYPITEFFTAFNDEIAKFGQDQKFLTSVETCRVKMRASFETNNIKY